jgi:IS30 family transposase
MQITTVEIAKKLGRSHSSLSRELRRNAKYENTYLPCRAQRKADKRTLRQRRKAPLKNSQVYLYVRKHLRICWSPEQIAGRLPLDHPGETIDDETIYRYIYQKDYHVKREKLWKHLTLRRKKRMKKEGRHVKHDSRILEAISIDKRPKVVDKRKQIGHWESDNVIGKQTDKTALSTTVERVLKVTLISKLTAKTADAKTKALFARMATLPEKLRKTMTVDNGSENAHHKQITQSLGMDVYFCHAYHSWEKGTNENTNGRIRRYIPKGISIDTISEKEIAAIEWRLNTTPRKCLSFKTPYEALQEYLTKVV